MANLSAVARENRYASPAPVTPPADLVVPPLTESCSIASVGYGYPVSPVPPGSHSYFQQLRALPSHYRSWSLRDQPGDYQTLWQLSGNAVHPYWSYAPENDPYPQAQDAAKLYKVYTGSEVSASINPQWWFQIDRPLGDSVIFTCDWWFGPEFITSRNTHTNWKALMTRKPSDDRYVTHNWQFSIGGTTHIGAPHESFTFASCTAGWPQGIVRREPVSPTGYGAPPGKSVMIEPGVWTRWWIVWETGVDAADPRLDPWRALNSIGQTGSSADITGTWNLMSMWMADENRDAIRVVYRVPHCPSGIDHIDYELNASQGAGVPIGPYIAYSKNVVVLVNYPLGVVSPEGDPTLFQRPVG